MKYFRPLLGLFAMCASIGVSISLVATAWRNLLIPEADLVASFQGPLPPDDLSFWPAWMVVLALQLVLMATAWLMLAKQRAFVPMLISTFVVASVLEHRAFERDQDVWSAAVQPAQQRSSH
jgi:hypothetical protein